MARTVFSSVPMLNPLNKPVSSLTICSKVEPYFASGEGLHETNSNKAIPNPHKIILFEVFTIIIILCASD